jgi:hypothetical protein
LISPLAVALSSLALEPDESESKPKTSLRAHTWRIEASKKYIESPIKLPFKIEIGAGGRR